MRGAWWILLIGGTALIWSMYYDSARDGSGRLARWWVPRAQRKGRWAGPDAFLVSLAALLAYGLLGRLGVGIAQALGEPHWAIVTVLPAVLVYGPFVIATLPDRAAGYRSWRRSLQAAGANVQMQRAIAWWAGPPSIVGLTVIAVTPFLVFLAEARP